MKVTQLWLFETLWAIHSGILQARILEWVAFSLSRESSQPRDWTQVSCIPGRFFTSWATRESLLFLNVDIYLPFRIGFPVFHKFWYAMFPFSVVPRYFFFPLLNSSWHTGCSEVYCLISTHLLIFQFSFCYWFRFMLLLLEKTVGTNSIFLHLLRLFLWYNIWSILENISSYWEEYIFCSCWVKWFSHVCQVHFV